MPHRDNATRIATETADGYKVTYQCIDGYGFYDHPEEGYIAEYECTTGNLFQPSTDPLYCQGNIFSNFSVVFFPACPLQISP